MSYRDVSESLRAYRDRVSVDLAEARDAAKEAAQRAARVQVLEKELAETEGLLAKMGGPRTLPVLEDVAIAAPCSADWDQMVGDDKVRFCGQCEKNVYNLSALPRDEAEALLSAREGKMCVRLYKRADGTVLTSDCPVGVTRRRRRRAVAGVLGGGLLAAGAALAAPTTVGKTQMGSPVPARATMSVTMGDVAPVVGVVAPPATTAAASESEVPSLRPITGTPVPMMGRPRMVQGKPAAISAKGTPGSRP